MAKRTQKRRCATCGRSFDAPTGGRGRPRKHCDRCERPRGSQTPERRAATEKRSRGLRAQRKAAAPLVEGVRTADAALRWAAAARVLGDAAEHGRIVELAGLRGLPVGELVELARSARELHGDVLDGDLAGLTRRLQVALAVLSAQLLQTAPLIQPGQLAHGASALTKALQLLREIQLAGDDAPDPAELEVLGPDGQRLRVIDGAAAEGD